MKKISSVDRLSNEMVNKDVQRIS